MSKKMNSMNSLQNLKTLINGLHSQGKFLVLVGDDSSRLKITKELLPDANTLDLFSFDVNSSAKGVIFRTPETNINDTEHLEKINNTINKIKTCDIPFLLQFNSLDLVGSTLPWREDYRVLNIQNFEEHHTNNAHFEQKKINGSTLSNYRGLIYCICGIISAFLSVHIHPLFFLLSLIFFVNVFRL